MEKLKVYIFGWPSFIGGADTKLAHLIQLLHKDLDLTIVPNDARSLRDKYWTRFLEARNTNYCVIDSLPSQLSGIGLSMSNECFFTHGIALQAKTRGLKVIWSSEMMWHHKGELDAIRNGLVDAVLYTSELQMAVLKHGYGTLPSIITGNYVDPSDFPFSARANQIFTVGRLSRPALEKFPEDFPVFYEALKIPEVRFRIMAWDSKLKHKYRWHSFDDRWDLLKAEQETQSKFLRSLDLFVYPLGHNFQESWGRSTVEAMLSGCVVLVPTGHHLEKLVVHGENGFICTNFCDYQYWSLRLFHERGFRTEIAQNARAYAEAEICNSTKHKQIWMSVFQ